MAAATGMVLSVAQTLLSALQTKELREVVSFIHHKSQLEELEETVKTIKATLEDVDSKREELTKGGRDWVEKLKDAVYEADDLFDEISTLAKRHQTPGGSGKTSKKLGRFFSGNNPFLTALYTSRNVKKLRKELDSIVKNHTEFGLSDVHRPAKKREETSSYVYDLDVIGRKKDKDGILGMLLQDSNLCDQTVAFVTIVGMGGLGKTTLAQLVYNDDMIRREFPLRIWVCVSDEFGMKEILGKMWESITGENPGELGIDALQKKVRKHIEGKRYFLVLDDVWKESYDEWCKLNGFLALGGMGSRVLVTSRSKKVAAAIDNNSMYELKGLSEENSWLLFKMTALGQQDDPADIELVDIGKDIVKKCGNVPLGIRVIGSLLRGKDKREWLQFEDSEMAEMRRAEDGEDVIMSILMISYHHLVLELKICFSYSALFPKDYPIRKDLLINLWLAHGCLGPPDAGHSLEDVGEKYFSILLHRVF